MGKEIKILLPKLGESIVSGTVVQILKKEGDEIFKDAPLVEISTDKVNTEIPSAVTGKIKKIFVHLSQEIFVGDPIAMVEMEEIEEKTFPEKKSLDEKTPIREENLEKLFSPAVLQLAKKHHLSMSDLEKIPISQKGGRLSKKDIEAYLEKKTEKKETKKPLSILRKAIAQNLTKSFYEAPHASVFTEINMTKLQEFIEKNKEEFLKKNNLKLTITPFLAKALSHVLKKYPMLNSTLHQDMLTIKHYINLGIAVNTDEGVMVFVIKDAEKKSLAEIAQIIKTNAEKAKDHTLEITDTQEGSITLTNFGMTGVLMGCPIIRYPESAIIGAGSITKRWVVEKGNNTPVIGDIMMMSVTFDHRIVDGVYACQFLQELKKELEENISL